MSSLAFNGSLPQILLPTSFVPVVQDEQVITRDDAQHRSRRTFPNRPAGNVTAVAAIIPPDTEQRSVDLLLIQL
jgi:hypothetical protein